MIRYFAVATAIVVTIVVLATVNVGRVFMRIRVASQAVPASPRTGFGHANERAPNEPLRGDAPWALSALPECLTQERGFRGTPAYARRHLPNAAIPIVPPAKLVYGDCTISVIDGEAYVRRGSDLLRIPPQARFYRLGGELVLLRIAGRSGELRIYQPSNLINR